MVLVQDLALPERRAEDVRRRLFLGRARRLDPVRARRRRRPSARQARRLRRRPQGALLGRVGRFAGQGVSERARSRVSRALRDRLYEKAYDATEPAGSLTPRVGREAWPRRRRFRSPSANSTCITARSAAACSEGTLVKVIGTSTCDCAVVSADKKVADIPGICGIVKGAILPGYLRHRGRPVGGRRHFQMVGRGRLRRRRRASRATDAPRRRSRSPARRACWRSTGTTATAPSWSISCCPASFSVRTSTRRAPTSIAR